MSGRRRLLVWGGLLVALGGALLILTLDRAQRQQDQRKMLRGIARLHRLDPDLVEAVVHAESGGNPRAVSPAGAYGLMQLRPGTATEMAGRPADRPVLAEELFDPAFNVELGCRYLRWLARAFDGDPLLVLMGYNAGPTRVTRWLEAEPDPKRVLEEHAFGQTRAYVRKVLRYQRQLKKD